MPCSRSGPRCGRCEAIDYLTDEDWYLIGFFYKVEDQYINQTPNGGTKESPAVLTVRLEGYEAALRIGNYPRDQWEWLVKWGKTLHRLFRKLDNINWYLETGKPLRDITPADLGC